MKKFKKLVFITSPFLFVLVLMVSTDPFQLPIPVLTLPFILISIGCFFSFRAFINSFHQTKQRSNLISGLMTSILLLTLLLQSIRQLSFKDVVILLALLSSATFYVHRLKI